MILTIEKIKKNIAEFPQREIIKIARAKQVKISEKK